MEKVAGDEGGAEGGGAAADGAIGAVEIECVFARPRSQEGGEIHGWGRLPGEIWGGVPKI